MKRQKKSGIGEWKEMLNKDKAMLIVIDLQEKLIPAMESPEEIIDVSAKLIRGICALNVPKMISTQYVKGLGETEAEIIEAFGEDYHPVDKRTFSVMKCEEFREKFLALEKEQIIVCGTEAHICVQQSVLELREMGYEVYVPCDCIMSRKRSDKETAIARMRQAGAVMTTYESLLYELLVDSRAPEFKAITNIVK